MANTLGGIILLGVEEDDENRPILPLKGIGFQRGLSERVINIVLTNITPPVIPEVAVCPNKKEALVVIRVPQSHQTPHAISDNTQVYLRTGNRNNPEALDEFFDSANKFYRKLGYWGPLEFHMSLAGIAECALMLPRQQFIAPARCLDSDITVSEIVLASELGTKKPDLILQSAQRIAWAFNWNLGKELLDSLFIDAKRESIFQ